MAFAIEISEVGPAEYPLLEVLRDTVFGEFGHVSRSTAAAGWTGAQDLFVLIAHLEGNPVGFAAGFQRTPHGYYVNYMAILPDYRHQGIGRQFMQRMEAFARALGYERIEFNTQNKFHSMMCLGLSMGYRPIGMEQHDGTMNDLVVRFGKSFGYEATNPELLSKIRAGDGIAGMYRDATGALKVILRSEAR
jgi:GNAT superfamily N-acetyltransferase